MQSTSAGRVNICSSIKKKTRVVCGDVSNPETSCCEPMLLTTAPMFVVIHHTNRNYKDKVSSNLNFESHIFYYLKNIWSQFIKHFNFEVLHARNKTLKPFNSK